MRTRCVVRHYTQAKEVARLARTPSRRHTDCAERAEAADRGHTAQGMVRQGRLLWALTQRLQIRRSDGVCCVRRLWLSHRLDCTQGTSAHITGSFTSLVQPRLGCHGGSAHGVMSIPGTHGTAMMSEFLSRTLSVGLAPASSRSHSENVFTAMPSLAYTDQYHGGEPGTTSSCAHIKARLSLPLTCPFSSSTGHCATH